MVSDQTVKNLAEAFEHSTGSLADRLMTALEAGQAGGGDKRGMQSAALLVVRKNGGYFGGNDRFIDIRVYDAPDPIKELKRLLALHKLHFFPSEPADLLPITPDILSKLEPILLREPVNQTEKWLKAPQGQVNQTFLVALRDFMYLGELRRARAHGREDRSRRPRRHPEEAPLKIASGYRMTRDRSRPAYAVIGALSVCHLLNDMVQSLLPAIYPILKAALALDFRHIGLITLANQLTASLLQPVIGYLTDRKPKPQSLAIGMGFTLSGLLLLAWADHFAGVLAAAALVGVGSSIFHPESSRIARLASGGQHGLAQSLFQVGGNAGSSLGPLLAAFVVLPHGQGSLSWFAIAPLTAMVVLWNVGVWYREHVRSGGSPHGGDHAPLHQLSRRQVNIAIAVLLVLVFSKYVYLASLSTFYTFYLIDRFHVSVQSAQLHLFVFLGAVAAGTILGGPLGDRIGRKYVIWGSILGVLPFTLLLPHANLFFTGILSAVIGLILASAFSAIVVYAQELVPGNVGMIAGLFFGFAFGIAGLGAAVLGQLADMTSVTTVYNVCAWLPALGLLTAFLPDIEPKSKP